MNRECEKFRLNELTPGILKCLIFVQGLIANKDMEIRSRRLAKLKMDPKLTPEECQHIVNIKLDTARSEERAIARVNNVRPFKKEI